MVTTIFEGIHFTERCSTSLRETGGEGMSEAENIARNMLAKREEKGWSQAAAAEKCDLSERQYGEIERCHANPTLETLLKICKGLERTLAKLIAEPVKEKNEC